MESLKDMICTILDGLLAGKEVGDVLKYLSKKSLMSKTVSRISFKPKLFSCEKCNFQTRFATALKRHTTTIHKDKESPKPIKCETCELECSSLTNLKEHMISHKPRNKRPKDTLNCSLAECNSTFCTEDKLKEHKQTQHVSSVVNLEHISSISPTSSPPRKKAERDAFDNVEESEVEMIDLEIEANSLVTSMLEKRIKELEYRVEMDRILKKHLEEEINALKESNNATKNTEIPKHLSPVHENHLGLLRGYKMRYRSAPDGACLSNSFAAHAYEDPGEGGKVKKYLNYHIADNMDYYKNKIKLPFNETIGVGNNKKEINITTYEDLKDFFKSE